MTSSTDFLLHRLTPRPILTSRTRGDEMQQLLWSWSTESIKSWNMNLGFINSSNHIVSIITGLIRIGNLLICPQQKLIFSILNRFERQVLIFHYFHLRGSGGRRSGAPLRASSHPPEVSPATLPGAPSPLPSPPHGLAVSHWSQHVSQHGKGWKGPREEAKQPRSLFPTSNCKPGCSISCISGVVTSLHCGTRNRARPVLMLQGCRGRKPNPERAFCTRQDKTDVNSNTSTRQGHQHRGKKDIHRHFHPGLYFA